MSDDRKYFLDLAVRAGLGVNGHGAVIEAAKAFMAFAAGEAAPPKEPPPAPKPAPEEKVVAPKPAPAAADASPGKPAEAAPPADAGKKATLDDVRDAVRGVSQAQGQEAAVAVLQRFGVTRVTALDEKVYAEVLAACAAAANVDPLS